MVVIGSGLEDDSFGDDYGWRGDSGLSGGKNQASPPPEDRNRSRTASVGRRRSSLSELRTVALGREEEPEFKGPWTCFRCNTQNIPGAANCEGCDVSFATQWEEQEEETAEKRASEASRPKPPGWLWQADTEETSNLPSIDWNVD